MTHFTNRAAASIIASCGAALCGAHAHAQSTAFLDTAINGGLGTAVVGPGQGFRIEVRVRSQVPVTFNAVQFTVYCTVEGMRIDDYEWSVPFVTGGPWDYSLDGAALPLLVNRDTLEGTGYPLETADVEFATFDFTQAAGAGELLNVWVRAPLDVPVGSTIFIAARPDLFSNGFQVIPVAPGIPLRVEISEEASPRDIDGDGRVNGIDLAILLSAWDMQSPVGQADGDINGDGYIDAIDLSYLLAAWTG